MKTALLCVCAMLVCAPTVTGQSWRDNRARLCFDRPEDNGAINVLESWIRIQEYDVPLIGGQATCLYLRAETSVLTVTSTIPYDPHSRNTEACKSKPLKLELAPDEDRTFSIEPASNKDGYTCGWRIRSTGSSHKRTTASQP